MNADEIVRALRDCAQDLLDVKGGTRKSAFVMVEASSLIENLQKQLAEAQRRADAAVADLTALLSMDELCPIQCEFCRWQNDCDGEQKPEWRGPQDEKGEAE